MSTSVNKSSGRSPSQPKDVITSSATSSSSTTSNSCVSTSSTITSQQPAKTPITQSIRESIYSAFKNGSSSNGNQSGRSPISPSRITRLQEKEEMQNLNDRLVIYIDTVRRLESENNRLQSIVLSYNENSTRDVTEIKKLYENELEDAKRLIDELAKEKAKYEIQVNKLKADAEETAAKLNKKERDFKQLESKYKLAESESIEFKSRYESLQAEQQHDKEELKHLRPHAQDLEQQLIRLKKQLEDETLQRVDLENKNQTLKEDLAFKAQLYGKEIDQLRSSKRVEIEQVDVRLRDEYDSRLVSELQRIRDETEYKIHEMKEEVERRYLNKHGEVEANLKRSLQIQSSLKDEVISYKAKQEDLLNDIKSLQFKLQSQESKLKELEDKLKKANQKYDKDMTDKDNDLVQLRKEIQDLLLEYQELYDIKIALDMEIAAYRKLLESEEQRLNISSSLHTTNLGASFIGEPNINSTAAVTGPGVASSTRSGKKRKMASTVEQDESIVVSSAQNVTQSQKSECGIEIAEHEFDGKYVRLVNTTNKEIPIGGWQLRRNADNQLTEYKFNKSTVIKPGQHITVWSSSVTNITHDPPTDIVMSSQRWFIGDSMITILVDREGNEQARRESQRSSIGLEKKLRSTPTRGSTSSTSTVTTTTSDMKVSSTAQAPTGSTSAVQKLFGLWKS